MSCRVELTRALDQQNLIVLVDLAELDFDDFAAACGNGFANVGCFDGKFAMAAIDEDGELNAAGTTVIEQRVERGAHSASGVKNIIAKYDIAAFDVESYRARRDDWPNASRGQVIAIELDVESASIDRSLLDARDEFAKPLGQRNAAALDSYQGEIFAAVAFLNNLMGKAHQSTFDLRGRHKPAFQTQIWVVLGFAHSDSLVAFLSTDNTRFAEIG